MIENLSSKNKTMLFVTSVMIVFSIVLFSVIYINQKNKLITIEKEHYTKLQSSYNKIVNKHNQFYINRIKANINSKGIKEAFFKKDRKKLYELSKGRWNTLKSENKYLKVMHFHNPDGTSFLRMHQPNKFGDNIAKFRQMVAKMHKVKKPLFGFEAGIFNLAYRIFLPIFYQNEYIGALEFGSRPDQLLESMDYFNDIKGSLFVKNEKLNLYKEDKSFQRDGYTLQYTTIENENLTYTLPNDYKFQKEIHIKIEDKKYAVYSFNLKDFTGEITAKIVFFQDISYIEKAFINTSKQLLFLLLGLLIILLIIINFGFSKIIKRIEDINKELVKNIKESKRKDIQIKNYISLVDKNVIISTTDIKGDITQVSKAFCEISGYDKEELIGKNHRIIKHPNMNPNIHKTIWETITKDKTWRGEIQNLAKDGSSYWVDASISPIYDEFNNRIGYTAIRHNITDKKVIEIISITDGLTNIYNRRHFNEIFPTMINDSKESNQLLCFLIMDIDHFKQYNDTYGHQMGDDVLIKVASCIKNSLDNQDDICFRLGGEEFGVLFKSLDKEKAITFANKVRENIEKLHIEHTGNGASSYVTASMGLLAKKPNDIDNEDVAYKEADDLLYKAKESGRNTVCSN